MFRAARHSTSAQSLVRKVRREACIVSMGQKKAINIEIVSDTICPWCMVGRKRLQKAMDHYRERAGNDIDFTIQWKPFRLNPDLPQDDPGRDKMLAYVEKFGRSRVQSMLPHMTETFAGVGENYNFTGLTGSTMNSHRLTYWAGVKGGAEAQDHLMMQLFKAYFTQAKFLNDSNVLVEAAVAAGFDAAEARAVIADPTAYRSEVHQELKQVRGLVTGVPYFVFNKGQGDQEVHLSGAQEPATFERAFEHVLNAAA